MTNCNDCKDYSHCGHRQNQTMAGHYDKEAEELLISAVQKFAFGGKK